MVLLCLVLAIGFAAGWLDDGARGPIATASPNGQAAVYLPSVFQSYVAPFIDNFSNPASGWPIMQTSIGTWGYVNGQYRMQLLTAGYVLYAGNNLFAGDFQAETSAYSDTPYGAQYGIYFGSLDGVGRYVFAVFPYTGIFSLYRRDDVQSTWIPIISGTYSSAIALGTLSNNLKVTRSGSTITMYANGQQIGQATDVTLGAGYVGMVGGGNVVNDEEFFTTFAFVPNTTTPLPFVSQSMARSAAPQGSAGSDPLPPASASSFGTGVTTPH
jgi:hypothetical protein